MVLLHGDEKYGFYFSREVIDHISAQKYGESYADKRFWGKDKQLLPIDLYSEIENLKSDHPNVDEALSCLKKCRLRQQTALKEMLADHNEAIRDMISLLREVLSM